MNQIGKLLPQVAEVMPVKLLMTACGSTTDVMAIHGVDKEIFTSFYKYNIAPDVLAKLRASKTSAIAEIKVANRFGWKTGDFITLEELNGISFTLAGTFKCENASQDNIIIAGRRFIQEAVDEQGIANHVLVRLNPGADPNTVCKEIDALSSLTVDTLTQPEHLFLLAAIEQLDDLMRVSRIIISIILMVMLVAIGNAISMGARERYPEMGVLRTLGFSKMAIMLLIIGEAVIYTLTGGIIGALIVQGFIVSGITDTLPTWGTAVSISMTADFYTWAVTLGIVSLAGFFGSIIPAWQASRINICNAIRKSE